MEVEVCEMTKRLKQCCNDGLRQVEDLQSLLSNEKPPLHGTWRGGVDTWLVTLNSGFTFARDTNPQIMKDALPVLGRADGFAQGIIGNTATSEAEPVTKRPHPRTSSGNEPCARFL